MLKILSIALISLTFSPSASIDRISFYKAFESNSQSTIEQKLESLEKSSASTRRDAYIGALIMKQSQFLKTPKEKVNRFKTGAEMTNKAIELQPNNGEFRFLRFAIQENAPKILKYSGNLEEDKKIILNTYRSMDVTLKKVIKEYAKQSALLSVDELK